MNKILFALLFASVSFCATQEAFAAKKKPKKKDNIAGTAIRRTPRISLSNIVQDALREEEARQVAAAVMRIKNERIMQEEAEEIERMRKRKKEIESIRKDEEEKTPARRFIWGSHDKQDQGSPFLL